MSVSLDGGMWNKMLNYHNKNKWIIAQRTETDLVKQILVNRGIKTETEQAKFLHPNFERDFLDPFLLKDMKKAVQRIILALKNNEKIGIFGDYDADGIPGTALLVNGLKLLNYENLYPIIPTRLSGYGLKNEVIDEFIENNCQILITIDNGIASRNQVEYASKKCLETIIIDHHLIQPKLKPTALAIINPKQKLCKYPDKNLAACGLVFKFLWALFTQMNKSTNSLKWLVDLVGISTISDLVPLVGENRLFAYFGLITLNKTKNIGLLALFKSASISLGEIDVYKVGFMIAPRLNAVSRMGREKTLADHPNMILDLLTTSDQKRANILAKIISEVNILRQQSLDIVVNQALAKAQKQIRDNRKVIAVYHPDWPEGVVGLAASRLVEQFNRPAFVLSGKGEELVGSARSIKQFNLVKNLAKLEKILIRSGGHAMAAGLSIKKSNLEKFSKKIEAIASQMLSEDDFVKEIKVDSICQIDELSITKVKKIQQIAPFGMGNPQPIFLIEGKPTDIKVMGKNFDHLSLRIVQNENQEIKVVIFSGSNLVNKIRKKENIQIIGNLKINQWNDSESVQLYYIDCQ